MNDAIEIECPTCGSLCVERASGNYEPIKRTAGLTEAMLRDQLATARKRLRAVMQYHGITKSHIDSMLRTGYGEKRVREVRNR